MDNSERVALLIGGETRYYEVDEYGPVHNPSTGEVIARVPLAGAAAVDEAVHAANKAFEAWSLTPVGKRTNVLHRYRALIVKHFDELSRLLTRENGKTLEEARGDVQRGLEVVEFAAGVGHLAQGEALPQIATGLDAVTSREPLGVCAGITPFNFPAMVPLWMFPVAIACGNTFVLKPSEKVPLTANRLAELFREAGLPDGVLNVVHGGRAVVEALCGHPDIKAISFVGSSRVAEAVYRMGGRTGKRVQAAGGAKNLMLVMPDADPDSTLRGVIGAAYGCSGQRCMAGSLLMGIGEAADMLRERLPEAMDNLVVEDTSANDHADMGPVIDGQARDRIFETIANGAAAGATLVRDGRSGVPDKGFFVGPTLFDNVTPAMEIFKTEIFGPVLSMLRPRSLAEAIAWVNRIGYGNGASIFTNSGGAAREFARGIQCGMIGVNVGVPAPIALFSFSGWNDSFFGDLHVQGMEGVLFYTRQKVVLSRWDTHYVRTQGW